MFDRETITRRNVPHWYVPHAFHFVTYRLADTIPVDVLQELRAKRDALLQPPGSSAPPTPQLREKAHKLFFAGYDKYLDRHRAVDWLAQSEVAALIRRSLYFHDNAKYHLLAYSIMPNHVHVLLQPIVDTDQSLGPEQCESPPGDELPDGQSPLSNIMHSLKSYTANEANKLLHRTDQFWQHESYDHWVRDEDELERIVNYIAGNPVKAGLVRQAHEWFFCSAHDRFLLDGSRCGFLPIEERDRQNNLRLDKQRCLSLRTDAP